MLQYTSRPEIHDDKFHFCIEDQIVPVALPEDYPDRQVGETLFVFPFVKAESAYRDIANKLRTLSYPLLFLSHLQSVSFTIEKAHGLYKKELRISTEYNETMAEQIHLIQYNGETNIEEDMWLFSRNDDAGRRCSVGFSLNENGMLRPTKTEAYCFFRTKENTGLNFFIHAPFLLNDSREHIVAGSHHNHRMIQLLAELAADSIVYLRDIGINQGVKLINDGILDIIPTSEDGFSKDGDADKVSFLPIFVAVREKMRTEALLPTIDGYVSGERAYWADTEEITQIISNKQLEALSRTSNAQWVFTSIGRDRGRSKFTTYIDDIVGEKWCDDNAVITGRKLPWNSRNPNKAVLFGLDAAFIESQSVEWLHSLYRWLSGTERRTQLIKRIPVFLNQASHATSAFDENNKPTLFFPSGIISPDRTIDARLLENDGTVAFLKKVGITDASKKDYIYNELRPKYETACDNSLSDSDADFKLLFEYYCNECPKTEIDEFIKLIKNWKFLACFRGKDVCLEKANSLYFPSNDLLAYFASSQSTPFIDYKRYCELVEKEKSKYLLQFFRDIKVKFCVAIEETVLDIQDGINLLKKYKRLPSGSNWYSNFQNHQIANCANYISGFQSTPSKENSLVLFRILQSLIREKCHRETTLADILSITYEYWPTGRGKHAHRKGQFTSNDMFLLRNTPWIVDCNGEYRKPCEVSKAELNENYDLSEEGTDELLAFLQIALNTPNLTKENTNLTDEQRKDIEYGRIVRDSGYSVEEVKAILEREKQKNNKHYVQQLPPSDASSRELSNLEYGVNDNENDFQKSYERQSLTRKKLLLSRMERVSSEESEVADEQEEADGFSLPPIDFEKRIKRADLNNRKELDKLECEQALYEQFKDLNGNGRRYSYAWFRVLMELEALNRNDNESGSREISISFGSVELEPSTERTLLLKQPSRNIPQWMEDLAADIPLTLQVKGREHRVRIEVASVKGFTLHTRLRNAEAIKGIDLSNATASISVQNPGFLLKSLQDGFASLHFADDYNLKKNLGENIKFVFGPPGTGKTTYLAREEIIPLMQGADDKKILVIAPTNKAADVLATRIMELMGEDNSYKDWLIRFGTTFDEKIEQSVIYRDRSFYLAKLPRCVFITTIARFPYDSIGGQALREVDWDHVIIDEASMIPIANITYPLYQTRPKQFIIAGDPLQIQPVAQVEQDENIYEMVGLKSFTNPHTEPHNYEVKLLTTQYRSIPSVGEVFSQFAYGGILKHARTEDDSIQQNICVGLDLATLNIIKFPVSEYEGIYRAKKLGKTPYHIYSALLAHELAVFLAHGIGARNADEPFSIGIISPYRAQADLIERLLERAELPPNVGVQVGTIHGFQGDECNMVIAVFNPPPVISDNKSMFLNKLNIINVSISRARDCLIVFMPDEETEHLEKLKRVNKVERLIKSSGSYREYNADMVEEILFGRAGYLEENTFSTSHQNVNVYGLPEKRYEIRSEENALDVQIFEENSR